VTGLALSYINLVMLSHNENIYCCLTEKPRPQRGANRCSSRKSTESKVNFIAIFLVEATTFWNTIIGLNVINT
jgi:hypothetical protein